MDERSWIRRLPWRQKNKAETKSAQIKFSPILEIIREDGWQYLELRLMNRSSWAVWVEEANVVLADLVANFQTAVPPERVKHEILQNVNPHETVGVSFAGVIYDAAGSPRGQYSCLVITDVRYRVFDEWCVTKLGTYRVKMEARDVFDLRRASWYDKKMKQINGRGNLVTTDHKGRRQCAEQRLDIIVEEERRNCTNQRKPNIDSAANARSIRSQRVVVPTTTKSSHRNSEPIRSK